MLKIKNQPHNSLLVQTDSQEELAETFIRFQEYYESPNPNFRGQIFTLGQLKHWYSKKNGADTYHLDWKGFNFPSYVLKPFREGLFDPLTRYEKKLLSLLKYRNDDFYIIGAIDDSVLRHELSHAMYYNNSIYKQKIDSILNSNKSKLKKIIKYLLDKGYDISVINDEIQAYITDNDDDFIINNTPKIVIQKINDIYLKYKDTNL